MYCSDHLVILKSYVMVATLVKLGVVTSLFQVLLNIYIYIYIYIYVTRSGKTYLNAFANGSKKSFANRSIAVRTTKHTVRTAT